MTNNQLKEIASAHLQKQNVHIPARAGRLRGNESFVLITFNAVNVWVVSMSRDGTIHNTNMIHCGRQ